MAKTKKGHEYTVDRSTNLPVYYYLILCKYHKYRLQNVDTNRSLVTTAVLYQKAHHNI